MSYIDLAKQTGDSPAAPSGYLRLYAKSDGIYLTDDATPPAIIGPLLFNPLIWPAAQTVTIASGQITTAGMTMAVDTESVAATDDLDSIINQVTFPQYNLVIIRPANDARTVVVKHNVGNIFLSGGADITLDDLTDHLMLFYDGTQWVNLQ